MLDLSWWHWAATGGSAWNQLCNLTSPNCRALLHHTPWLLPLPLCAHPWEAPYVLHAQHVQRGGLPCPNMLLHCWITGEKRWQSCCLAFWICWYCTVNGTVVFNECVEYLDYGALKSHSHSAFVHANPQPTFSWQTALCMPCSSGSVPTGPWEAPPSPHSLAIPSSPLF